MSGANAPAPKAPVQDHEGTEQRGHEPSMEEILASIRRIISDDQMLPLSPRASVPPLPSNRWEREAAARGEAAKPEPEASAPAHVPSEDEAVHDHTANDTATSTHPHPEAHDEHHEDDVLDLAEVAHGDHKHDAEDRARDVAPAHLGDLTASHDASSPAETSPTTDGLVTDQPTAAEPAPASPMIAAAIPHRQELHVHEREHEPIVSDDTVSSVSGHFHQLAATMLMQNFPPVDQIARELLRPMIKTWLDDNLPVMVERLVRAEIERVARGGR